MSSCTFQAPGIEVLPEEVHKGLRSQLCAEMPQNPILPPMLCLSERGGNNRTLAFCAHGWTLSILMRFSSTTEKSFNLRFQPLFCSEVEGGLPWSETGFSSIFFTEPRGLVETSKDKRLFSPSPPLRPIPFPSRQSCPSPCTRNVHQQSMRHDGLLLCDPAHVAI